MPLAVSVGALTCRYVRRFARPGAAVLSGVLSPSAKAEQQHGNRVVGVAVDVGAPRTAAARSGGPAGPRPGAR